MTRSLLLLSAFMALCFNTFSQANIAAARTFPIGSTVTVSGLVTNGPELGNIRYIQDETAGIGVFDPEIEYFQRGDMVAVTGKLGKYNQLLEVVDLTAHLVFSGGNPLPDPVLITIDDIGEQWESILIRINQAEFVNAGGYFSGNSNYSINAPGGTGMVRIHINSNLAGQLIPNSKVDLTGILSQFHFTNPNDGYQLLLRDANDIIHPQTIAMTSPLQVKELSTAGFSLYWETSLPGTSQMFYGNTPDFELGTFTGNTIPVKLHTLTLNGMRPSELFFVRAFSVRGSDTAFSLTRAVVTSSLSSADIKVYFTSGVDHSVSSGVNAVQVDDALDDTLISYISRTKQTLDIAVYSFSVTGLSDIAGAINEAYSRGVRVRIIVNGSTTNLGIAGLNPGIRWIASPTGSNNGIMHNKFAIFDAFSQDPGDPYIWTGSCNWTSNNINTDANHVIIIQDKSMAIAYTMEFEEMWGSSGPDPDPASSRFGSAKLDNTPHEFIIGGKEVFLYFSPSDGVNQRIIDAILSAEKEIAVNTMLITRADIGYALRDQKVAGIETKILVNREEDCSETVLNTLKPLLGSDFRRYGEAGILHIKCMIVDHRDPAMNPLVLTGSHNWSANANDKNDENTLVIFDAEIANIFYQEFMARFNSGIALSLEDDEPGWPAYRVFPNPSSGRINISLSEQLQGRIILKVFNHYGQMVYQAIGEWDASGNILADLGNFKPGLYFIELYNEKARYSEKIILVR